MLALSQKRTNHYVVLDIYIVLRNVYVVGLSQLD